jgi:hypothetical protein
VTPKRIYLMSMAASGKSTFARANEFYAGYRIIDYATLLPGKGLWTRSLLYLSRAFPLLRRAVSKNRDMIAINHQNYSSGVLELMRSHKDPIAVLGRRLPAEFIEASSSQGISVGIVLISEEQHRQNCLSRRAKMKSPLPFMHHWTTDFDTVQAGREKMRTYAQQYNIPVFDSFELAVDTLKVQTFHKRP